MASSTSPGIRSPCARSSPTVSGSATRPSQSAMPAKIAIAMTKLKAGPAATVAARAQSGASWIAAPAMRASAGPSAAPTEAALASPLNLT